MAEGSLFIGIDPVVASVVPESITDGLVGKDDESVFVGPNPSAPRPPIIISPRPALELASATVFVPTIISLFESKDTVIPLMIAFEPPGISVEPAISTAVGLALIA